MRSQRFLYEQKRALHCIDRDPHKVVKRKAKCFGGCFELLAHGGRATERLPRESRPHQQSWRAHITVWGFAGNIMCYSSSAATTTLSLSAEAIPPARPPFTCRRLSARSTYSCVPASFQTRCPAISSNALSRIPTSKFITAPKSSRSKAIRTSSTSHGAITRPAKSPQSPSDTFSSWPAHRREPNG